MPIYVLIEDTTMRSIPVIVRIIVNTILEEVQLQSEWFLVIMTIIMMNMNI
jgi:hypothetical protein